MSLSVILFIMESSNGWKPLTMVIIRPTASLAKKMKVKLDPSKAKSTTVLGDWLAIDFVMNRKQYILCMSAKSRLSIVMQAAPYSKFPYRLENDLYVVLRELGLDESIIEKETNEMPDFTLAKTNNRSILGTMKEFIEDLTVHCQLGRLDLNDTIGMSLLLSRNITLTLVESYPYEAAFKMLGHKEVTPNNILDFKKRNK